MHDSEGKEFGVFFSTEANLSMQCNYEIGDENHCQ